MKATIEKCSYGVLPDGAEVDLYTLANSDGFIAKVSNYGTIITELHVPDARGEFADVVLGFDRLDSYLKRHPYFGATVGRVANRIAGGQFTLNGRSYTLATNDGPNHLHGGIKGFDKVLWKAKPQDGASVKFSYTSPDGEEGYPGTLAVEVTISLTDGNALSIDYTASTDQTTLINLTNHSYFNLAGQGDILSHELFLSAGEYTPADANRIPTGEIASVGGTPMDFTNPAPIGSRMSQLGNTPLGYDTNYVINRAGKGLALAARVCEPKSGRVMEVHTTQPGVQFYTGNFLDGTLTGKRGTVYRQHTGFCLETQHYPDSVHHPDFPSVILHSGQNHHHTTVHRFLTS